MLIGILNDHNYMLNVDDITFFCNFNNNNLNDPNITEEALNEELKLVTQWFNTKQLSLNVGKTKFMVFHSARKVVKYPVLVINIIPIDGVTNFNYTAVR